MEFTIITWSPEQGPTISLLYPIRPITDALKMFFDEYPEANSSGALIIRRSNDEKDEALFRSYKENDCTRFWKSY